MANNAVITVSNPYEHLGHIVAGGGGRTDDLKYALPPADDVTINSGSLCSQNSNGKAQLGLASSNSMPLWSVNNIGDYDVANTTYGFGKGSPSTFGSTAVGDATSYGRMNFLVGGRCYEIFTTEYDTASYARDDLLRASSTTDGNVEKIVGAWDGSVQVVGQVSRGTVEMPDRKNQSLDDVLFLWTRSELVSS